MKKEYSSIKVIFSAFLLTAFLISGCTQMNDSGLKIIPAPWETKISEGVFKINNQTLVFVESGNQKALQVAKYLVGQFEKSGDIKLPISETVERATIPNTILLTSAGIDKELGTEGYVFESNPSGVIIKGKPAGLFYGVQTLFQLLPPQIYNVDSAHTSVDWEIPAVRIKDKPRFPWRGMHLDVCRHIFPVDFIKKYIDYIAMHKMNVFHWHLTEDQGWRIEIKKYPQLTEIGAYRDGTVVGHVGKPHVTDDIRYGGYYTQDEIREIVDYARDRFITVVPEIEMPGHSVAALASYPHLSCTGGPFKVRQVWGIEDDIYCAGKNSVFSFLQDVLTEVLELFPSEYIHIGGDEAPKDRWENCPKCQQRIKDEGLKDEHELQSYFIKRIEEFLNSKGRQIIGWDEILEGGLAPNAAVMSWRGIEGGIAAAQQTHDVVMSPTSHCYFDYYQSDESMEPLAIGGFLPLEKVYEFEPIPVGLSTEQEKHILGAQGNVWTEYIKTPDMVEYMALPRMCALAEVVWSTKDQRDLSSFLSRMNFHYDRMDELGINYFQPPLKGFAKRNVFINETMVKIEKQRLHSEVRYTLDGTDPTKEAALYVAPFGLTETTTLKAREFMPNGRTSRIYKALFIKQKPFEAAQLENEKNGIQFEYFEFDRPIDTTDDLKKAKPRTTDSIDFITFPYEDVPEYFGLIFSGYVKIPTDGVYTFTLLSNDGSRLFVNDLLIVDNDGWHGSRERYGQIALKEGFHPLRLLYLQVGGGKELKVFIEGPNMNKHEIKSTELCFDN
jgi:hexosaminidase